MCGIAGYIGNNIPSEGAIRKCLTTMERRGPDAQRFVTGTMHQADYALLHARLSIIDLDPRCHQPYEYEHCTLIFNGEIYNYIELRDELIKEGYQFNTDSDTEVLIKAYHCYGKACVEKFEGMWAFALVDHRANTLFLSRDRFAEKPLYYLIQNGGICFASEIKQIEALVGHRLTPNINQAYRFLVNGHKALNKYGEQFYENVKEVGYGESLTISTDLSVQNHKYWTPAYDPIEMDEGEAIERIQKALIRSVELRLRADVPLAFCLSGGVDSSAMASIAVKSLKQDVQTFSIIDRDPRYNELENIQATVDDLGCKHQLIELSPEFNYLDQLEKLVGYHDAPVATISYLVHSRLISAMSDHGYKVSISGTGADELFTGYYDHFLLQMPGLSEEDRKDRLNFWRQYPAKAVRNPLLQDPLRFVNDPSFRDHIFLNNQAFSEFLNRDFTEGFKEEHYSSDLLRNRMLNELYHEVVRVILKEDDLNAMYYSIENRSPFLDAQLFKTAYSIPSKLLIQKGYNKYLLRQSLKGILNDKVRLSREKKGFNASLNSVIDFSNSNHVSYILDDSKIYEWVDKSKIEALMKRTEFPNSYKKFFFNFLNLKIWLS
ncbi:MAG: hypothetical protein Salg2KO_13010 [Salibacteraceae bacterium]